MRFSSRRGAERGNQSQRLAVIVQGQVHFHGLAATQRPRRPAACRRNRPAARPVARPAKRRHRRLDFFRENRPRASRQSVFAAIAGLDHQSADFVVVADVLASRSPASATPAAEHGVEPLAKPRCRDQTSAGGTCRKRPPGLIFVNAGQAETCLRRRTAFAAGPTPAQLGIVLHSTGDA